MEKTTERNNIVFELGELFPSYYYDSEKALEEIDKFFPVVKVSSLSLNDEFMAYQPKNPELLEFKYALEHVIRFKAVADFRAQVMEPSVDEYGRIIYSYGKLLNCREIEKSHEWWSRNAEIFMPGKESRLGNELEWTVFVGTVIKELVEVHGYTASAAWRAVYDYGKVNLPSCLSWWGLKNSCKIIRTYEPSNQTYKKICNNYPKHSLIRKETISSNMEKTTAVGWIVLSV